MHESSLALETPSIFVQIFCNWMMLNKLHQLYQQRAVIQSLQLNFRLRLLPIFVQGNDKNHFLAAYA